ncbi:MAG: hypothetical protein ACK4Q5_03155 [Saprospiraceae bacterium]
MTKMFSEKLLSLLQTFSKVELNRFRKYLVSPYLNDQPDLVRLFDRCDEAVRKGSDALTSLDKEMVWRQLYPGKKFDDATLRRLASDLTQMALRFRAAELKQGESLAEMLDLQRVLERPELAKHLAGLERQIQKTLDGQQAKPSEHYLARFQMHWNIFNRASKVVSTADYMEKLLPADRYLECFYIIQKLKFYTAWLVYRGFRSTDTELHLMGGFWDFIREHGFEEVPLIAIYQQVIHCLEEPDEEWHFRDLMASLRKFGDELAKEDLREFYHIAQNYCAFKINKGQTEYYREVFQIFKGIIQQNILLEDGQLSEGVFKNIITTSLQVGEYEWAEKFILDYAPFLPARIRENARSYNLANLYFFQKKYGPVIELLRNIEYNDVSYALGSRIILVRTYYETGELLALDSMLDSFKIFLRRNKVISKTTKRECTSFLSFLHRLVTLDKSRKTQLAALRQKIMLNPSVIAKKWLLEKIDALEQK